MTIGLILTAFGLGLRHGVDWDHIAAIADLSSSAENRRRGFFLSFLYAVGHAAVVIVLGILAILFSSVLPDSVDEWMGRVVGLTLVALGLWIIVELLRKGRDFRLRSRWILVLNGTFAGLRRVRNARSRRRVAVEHSHQHEHVELGDAAELHDDSRVHDDVQAHDHAHGHAEVEAAVDEDELVSIGRRSWNRARRLTHGHAHTHQHEAALASGAGPGNGTAAGIGVLHGIGVESPTQIAVFVASTSLVGVGAGIGLLVAWVLGLVVANSALAAVAAVGLLEAERNFAVYVGVAIFVAITSVAMGVLLLTGGEGPPLL